MILRKKHNGIEGITKAKIEKLKMPVYRAKPHKTKLAGNISIDLVRLDPELVAQRIRDRLPTANRQLNEKEAKLMKSSCLKAWAKVVKSEKYNTVDNNVYGNASGSFSIPE